LAFRLHTARLWRRVFRHRSQKDGVTWKWIAKLAADFLPNPRILHRGRPVINVPTAIRVMLMGEHQGGALTARMRMLVADMQAQWRELDRRIAAFEAEFTSFAKEDEDARRLTTIPGVGIMNATALIAAISKAETFAHGPWRHGSVWFPDNGQPAASRG
jgi:transposase